MSLGGGIGLWIRSDLDYDVIRMTSIARTCEMQAISLNDKNISIINVYRPVMSCQTLSLSLNLAR